MKLITTSALALLVATGSAVAGSHTAAGGEAAMDTTNKAMEATASSADLIRSRDITGGKIYTINEANDEGWSSERTYETVGENWNEIGEIEDLVLSRDGKIVGIVAEVGGFLDIADKHVMIEVTDVSLVAVDDKTYSYVTRLNEEDLESMESVDEGFWN